MPLGVPSQNSKLSWEDRNRCRDVGMLSTAGPQCTASVVVLELPEVTMRMPFARFFQHAMVIDSRNSSILPRRGALLKVNQVASHQATHLGASAVCIS